MSSHIWGFAGGFLGGLLWSVLFAKGHQRWVDKRRDKKFLKFVSFKFPNAKVIEVISVAGSDEEAMQNVERRIRNASRTL